MHHPSIQAEPLGCNHLAGEMVKSGEGQRPPTARSVLVSLAGEGLSKVSLAGENVFWVSGNSSLGRILQRVSWRFSLTLLRRLEVLKANEENFQIKME